MATKKTSKPVAKEKKLFPNMEFYVDQLPGCCGIGVVANIKEKEGRWGYSRGSRYGGHMVPAPKVFATRKEQAASLYKEILERTSKYDWDHDYFSQLLISLVSSYDKDFNDKEGQHQFQELQDLLLKEGWTIYSVFINPNHKNEVTLFGKYFPERDKHPDDEDDDILDDDDVLDDNEF